MGMSAGVVFLKTRLYIGVIIAEFARYLPQFLSYRFIRQGGYSGDDMENPLFKRNKRTYH
jgi:hypothetical protein